MYLSVVRFRIYSLVIILTSCCLAFHSCKETPTQTSIDKNSLNRILLDSAYSAKKVGDTVLFKRMNRKGLELSIKLKDTFGVADAHWNYGSFYSAKEKLDSSFYHFSVSYNNFQAIKHTYNAGKMLFNMSVIQNNLKDYTGSEITTYRAISYFDPNKHQLNLYRCYNNLVLLYSDLGEFSKARDAHSKAIEFLNDVKNKRTFVEGSLNNIGLVYQKQGDYKTAINYFNQALNNDSLKFKNPSLFAKLIDNKAYNRLLSNDTLGVSRQFFKSLSIRDSLNFVSGILINQLHLSKYYAFKNDTSQAITFAQEAHHLAKSVDNYRDQLEALQLLAIYDSNNSGNYLTQYVQLNDSLQNEERAIRNKFTRIRFETDEYIKQTEKLSKEKLLITIISITTLLLIAAFFIIRLQRANNKRLNLEQEQQKDREEIYQLMLDQQFNQEEGRKEERTRIASELHDGVLGSMYGTRLALGFLILELDSDDETKAKCDEYLEQMLLNEKEVRSISHALKNNLQEKDNNFIETVEAYLGKLNIASLNFEIQSNNSINWNQINDEIKVNFFRIIQESFYNTIKHAVSKNFTIKFSLNNELLTLVIEDDGIGFDVKNEKRGIGLKNLEERLRKLGGLLEINSSPGLGTKITASVKHKQ